MIKKLIMTCDDPVLQNGGDIISITNSIVSGDDFLQITISNNGGEVNSIFLKEEKERHLLKFLLDRDRARNAGKAAEAKLEDDARIARSRVNYSVGDFVVWVDTTDTPGDGTDRGAWEVLTTTSDRLHVGRHNMHCWGRRECFVPYTKTFTDAEYKEAHEMDRCYDFHMLKARSYVCG